jgi:hypothetical protein
VARERGKQKEMDAPRVVAVQVERVFAEKHRTFSPSRAGARAARTGGTPIAADQSEKCPFASRKELTKLLPIERKEFHIITKFRASTGAREPRSTVYDKLKRV